MPLPISDDHAGGDSDDSGSVAGLHDVPPPGSIADSRLGFCG